MARRRISEAETRKELIDPQLERAGWYLRDHSKVKIEIPACPDALFGVDGDDAELCNGVTDSCYLRLQERENVGSDIMFYSYVSIKEL